MKKLLIDFVRYIFDAIIVNMGLFFVGILLYVYMTYGGDSNSEQMARLFWAGVAVSISSNAGWRYFQKVFGFDSDRKLNDFIESTAEQQQQIQDDLTAIKETTISQSQFNELMQAINSIQHRLDEQRETGIDVETEDDEPVLLEIVDELSSTELLETTEQTG